jgi:hypothetical protein
MIKLPIKNRPSRPFLFSFLATLSVCFFCAAAAHAQWTAMNPVRKVQQESDGVVFSMGTGTLKV